MARPGILRADTLELQDHEAPSAKAHIHPHHPQQHQDDAWGSGRSSHEGSELLEEDNDFLTDGGAVPMDLRADRDAVLQSATNRSSEDSDMTDGDADEADDDLVDKISSSPSINEDGGCCHSSYTRIPSVILACPLKKPSINVPSSAERLDGDDRKSASSSLATGQAQVRMSSQGLSCCRQSRRYSPVLCGDDGGRGDASKVPSRLKTFEGLKKYRDASNSVPALPSQYSLGSISESSSGSDCLDSNRKFANNRDADNPGHIDADDCHCSHDRAPRSEGLQKKIDINFEFVYALHTFVATVEGQANATKGDTMVLLDDSNSYWWLVRVVKDSSIGYLPAEHIETPTERLARLNKHRNADLASQMLSDSSEKSKNPLKKAMRRRNAKMVQFTAPTYYEASEVEWSDEGEDNDVLDAESESGNVTESSQAHEDGQNGTELESTTAAATAAAVAAAAPGAEHVSRHVNDNLGNERDAIAENTVKDGQLRIDPDLANGNDVDGKGTPSVTKNGNIRNTDSFFKDDTAEPKKMSLTPTLLRDSEKAAAESPRTSESQPEPSPIQDTFDQLDKSTSPTSDKFKDDRKRKEKKPGMLSGLFKRKDKKIKVDEAAGGTVRSSKDGETLLGSPTSSPGDSSSSTPRDRSPQATRKSSGNKLVKAPPASATNAAAAPAAGMSSPPNGPAKPAPLSPSTSATALPPAQPNLKQRSPGLSATDAVKPQSLRVATGNSPTERKEGGLLSPLSSLLPQSDQPKKEKLKKAKQRMDLDVDSSPEREVKSPVANSRSFSHTPPPRPTISTVHSEPFSDEMVSPIERHAPSFDSAGRPRTDSPVSRSPTPTESTSTVQTPQTESELEPKSSTAASSTVPEHHTTHSIGSDSQWDNVALRNYLDERAHDDVRDLLIRVHDRSEVVPLPDSHPTMLELGFHETQKQLDTMSAQLDGMLHAYLARSASRKTGKRPAMVSS